MVYFNLNGVIGEKTNNLSFYKNVLGEYGSPLTDYAYQFERKLINLEHAIQKYVFGTMEAYWEVSRVLYPLQEIGLSSESKVSVNDFKSLVNAKLPENTLCS